MRKDKKGQTFGIINGLIFGIAALIIAIIIALLIVTTIGGSEILQKETITVTNESDLNGPIVFANQTTYTVVDAIAAYSGADSFTATSVMAEYYQSNGTGTATTTFAGYNTSVAATNYTLNSATGVLKNATNYVFPNVSIDYTYKRDTPEIKSADWVAGNLTSGINKVSSKLPTVLLIAAIILILGILTVLIVVWQKLRGGQGGGTI